MSKCCTNKNFGYFKGCFYRYCDMSKGSLNVEWLCMDSAILLPPTGTPMTGIDFTKRLPCGEVCSVHIFIYYQ